MRAFAKQIGLSPSSVSLVFQGKRHLSPKFAVQIAKRLKWSTAKQRYFMSLLEFENPKTELGRAAAVEQIRKLQSPKAKFKLLEHDAFAVISVWYHNAILTLFALEEEVPSISMICDRLGLQPLEVELAILRLQNLGLIQFTENRWKLTHSHLRIKSTPSGAIRTYHKEMLKKAEHALDHQSFDERDFSNLTISVDPSQLALAKQRILAFRTELAELLCGQSRSEVYQLSVQLFKLTKPRTQASGNTKK